MTFLAPCGHVGIPVTVNYVTCPLCDGKETPTPLVETRTFIIYLNDSKKPVHSIRNVKISDGPDVLTMSVHLDSDCHLLTYRFVLCDDCGNVASPFRAWDYDFAHNTTLLIGAGKYTFHFKVPPVL